MSDESDSPEREEFDHAPIEHMDIWGGMSVNELVSEYGKAGIGAETIHKAVDIYTTMLTDDSVTNFFGLAGAMVPSGMRQIVCELIADGHIDALVTTGANLTHDTIEAIGGKHHHGRERGDNTLREHDEQLRDEQVDRIYNVYLPQEHFTLMEEHLRANVFSQIEESVSIQEFIAELGRANAEQNQERGIDEDPGIAATAYQHDVPIYAPAIQDSVLGLQAWVYSQTSSFSLDAIQDMTHITDLAFAAETAGAMVVGGGVPKNYVLQTMLITPEAYEYAIQLTMDPEHTGGLSGAPLEEARSWGKLSKSARNVTVFGDATVTLPLIVAAVRERIQ